MLLSVLIASRNGSRTLPDVLDSLLRAQAPPDGFEVVIVDNGSTDGTAETCRAYSERLPVEVLEEPRPGKNVALNRGVDVTRGEIVLLTDDDVVLPPNFMSGYHELAVREQGYGLFGGHIVALWQSTPDPRILDEVPLAQAFSITEKDRERGPIKAGRLYGPNMAVRREVFHDGLRFDERIGPNGRRTYAMGDETDFLTRAESAGFAAFFEPDIVVRHKVTDAQLGLPWLERRAIIAGRTLVQASLRRRGSLPEHAATFGFPHWALRKYLVAELKALPHRLRPSKPGAYARVWESAFLRGYLAEHRAQSTSRGGIARTAASEEPSEAVRHDTENAG